MLTAALLGGAFAANMLCTASANDNAANVSNISESYSAAADSAAAAAPGLTDAYDIQETQRIYEDSTVQDNTAEYSHNTVMVYTDEAADRAYIEQLCSKYGLSVLYDYNNFNMYALGSDKELDDKELAALIADLGNEEHILGAERDYIAQLDSNI